MSSRLRGSVERTCGSAICSRSDPRRHNPGCVSRTKDYHNGNANGPSRLVSLLPNAALSEGIPRFDTTFSGKCFSDYRAQPYITRKFSKHNSSRELWRVPSGLSAEQEAGGAYRPALIPNRSPGERELELGSSGELQIASAPWRSNALNQSISRLRPSVRQRSKGLTLRSTTKASHGVSSSPGDGEDQTPSDAGVLAPGNASSTLLFNASH